MGGDVGAGVLMQVRSVRKSTSATTVLLHCPFCHATTWNQLHQKDSIVSQDEGSSKL